MVKENFKIGVELEVDQSSLEKTTRQIQKKLADAIKQGTSGGQSPIAGGAATVRSVRETIKIDSSSFAREVQKAIATEFTAFTKASQEIVKALNKFTASVDKSGTSSPSKRETPGRAAAFAALAGRVRTLNKAQEQEGINPERTKEISRLLDKTAKIMTQEDRLRRQSLASLADEVRASKDLAAAKQQAAAAHREDARLTKQAARASGAGVLGRSKPQRTLVSEQQQGPTNTRIGANIDVRRAAGSQRTAGGGGGSKGALLGDAPLAKTGRQAYESPAEKRQVSSDRTSRYQAGSAETLNQVARSLVELKGAIMRTSGGRADEKFFERIGLAGTLKTGAGASPVIERVGKQAEHINKTITIIDGQLKDFSNIITDRVRQLSSPAGQERLGRMTRTAARDSGAFEAQARALVGEVFGGLMPVQSRQPLAGLQKGGEAQLTIKVTGELQKRLSALENEAEIVGELNKILWQAAQGVGELAKEFDVLRKSGVDVMTSFGLSDEVAARSVIMRGESAERGKRGDIEQIQMPVQTRNIADLGLGGIGAMRAARIFQPHQIANVMGGGVPSVMGKGEREMYQQGLYKPGAFKETKLALVDPNQMTDLFEDQFVYDPKLFQMSMKQVRSQLVHEISAGIEEGASLGQGQTLGTKVGGEAIKFDKTGLEAKVVRIQKTLVEGVEAFLIDIEELKETMTGIKLTERSGIKGIGKAVPDLAESRGLPPGTAIAMSTASVARRGSLRLPIEMMANNISDATGQGAQEIADKIVQAMSEGGKDFAAAVKAVAEEYGLKNFTGAETVTSGPLAAAAGGQASIMTGRVALGRLQLPGNEGGPQSIDERFMGAADIQGLKLQMSTGKMAMSMQENIAALTDNFSELGPELLSLMGNAEQATKAVQGLAVVLPEAFKRLPQAAAKPENLKGTLLDPDLASAMAIQLPGRQGNELLRMPATGVRAGERESFQTEIGTIGAGKISRQFDRIMEQATKVKALRGEVPLAQSSEAMEEASYRTNNAINEQIAAILKLGVTTEEGASAASNFVSSMMPLVKMLGTGSAGLQFKRGDKLETIQASPERYVETRKNLEQQMLAIRDVLGKRPASNVNIERLGAAFTNLDVLNKMMEVFGIRLDGTGDAAEEAMKRLEKFKEELLNMFVEAGVSRSKPAGPGGPRKRSLAQASEAGSSLAPIGLAIEFPTDVSEEMAKIGERLRQMRDAGANVDEALSAFERMSALQKPQGGIPRDVVLINKSDWENLIKSTAKKYQIPETEAQERLQRTGLLQRYPVTGPRSFLPTRLKPVGDEVLPKGNFGVAGLSAISSPKDLENMLAPLVALRSANLEKLEALGGVGPEAEKLAADIQALGQVINGVIPVFRSAGLNLDFDGDKILWHGDVAKRASSNLEDFSSSTSKAINLQDAFINILGKSVGKGGQGGIDEYSRFFGEVVKGRPEGLRKAVLRPADEEMAGFESQAMVAGKKSVALLSDMFNRMLLSVTIGKEKVGSAFETWIGALMLGINQALAQKHGSGGATGPAQFLSALRKGEFGQIQAGLGSGTGFAGGLGDLNKQMKSQMREQMLVAGSGAGGMGRLKEFFDAEGIGEKLAEELKTGNLTSIVDKAVEELDLYNILVRMFDMMKDNAIKAAVKGGATLEEAVMSVNESLTPQGKSGFVKGIDQRQILETLVPGYAMTRKSIASDLEGLPAIEKARKLLELLPQDIAETVTEGLDTNLMEMDADTPAQRLRTYLTSWLQSITDQGVKFLTAEQMSARLGGPAAGLYSKKEDQIYIQKESREAPFRKSLELLELMSRGILSASNLGAEGLASMKKGLENFIGTMGHESVHQAAEKFKTKVIDPLVNSMNAPKGKGVLSMGAAGPNADWLKEFVQKTPNLRKAQELFEGLKGAQAAGQSTFTRTTDKGEEVVEKVTQKRVQRTLDSLQNMIVQELLAYQFNPESMNLKGISQIPEAIQNILVRRLELLGKLAPSTVGAARAAGRAVDEIMSLMEATSQTGPAAARGMAQGRASELLDFAGRGSFVSGQEKLTAQERAIMFSRQEHGLTEAGRLDTGELGFGAARKFAGAQNPKLEGIAQEVKEIQDAIIAGVAPEELNDLHKKVRGLAGKTAAILGRLTKSGELAGASPMKEMAGIVQDFFMTVAQRKTVEARGIQREIDDMRSEGKVDTPEFGAALEKFNRKVEEINSWLEKATMERMGKNQSLAVGGTTRLGGDLLPPFRELGLDVARTENFQSAIRQQQGPGEEGAQFAQRYAQAIMGAVEAIREGASATETWSRIMSILAQHPESIVTDANKIQAIFTDVQRLLGSTEAKFSDSATQAELMAKAAAKTRDAIKGISPENTAEVMSAIMGGGTKQQKRAFAMGKGPGEQMSEAMSAMEARRGLLQRMVQSPEHKAMGSPKVFEPQQFSIIDPNTGEVVQKLTASFKVMGTTVTSVMKQAGAATHQFGAQMQNALRRVVQWGFASGVIYGTIRAFRSLFSTIVDVQNKMTELKKVMDTSITNFDALQNGAVSMSKEFGVAIGSVLEGMVVYGQQGLKMNEITERTRATLMAMNVTTLTATQATDALTAVMKVFSDDVAHSEQAVDAWAAVAAKHAISAYDLAIAVERTGSAAKTAGVDFNDLLGITTAIGSVTRQTGKEVATGVKFMMRAMRRPTATKALMGVDVRGQDMTGELRPATDILGELAGKWDSLSRAQQLNIAQAMAGTRHYNQFLVLMNNWEEAVQASEDAQNSQGFATRKNALAMQTFAKQVEVLKQTMNGLALSVGKSVLPAATGLVKVFGGLVNLVSYLPDPIMQIGVVGAAGMIAFHKAADLVLDTLMSIGGTDIGGPLKKAGLLKGTAGMLGGAFKGIGSAATMSTKGANDPIAAFAQYAGLAASPTKDMGVLAVALYKVRAATMSAADGFAKMGLAAKLLTGATGIGLVLIIGGLIAHYATMRKSGKEVEDGLYDLIGRSQDATSALQSQGSQLRNVAKAWSDYESAARVASDPSKLKESFLAGDYKSPLKALKDYRTAVVATGLSMAKLDPSSIQGMSETGDYLVDTAGGYAKIVVSATDAQKATTAALQTKVIKAYADEINRAQGFWDTLIERITGGAIDLSIAKEAADLRKDISSVAAEMDKLAEQGISSDFLQGNMNTLVGRELELREQMVTSAMNLKKILDQLPTFESAGLAQMALGPELRKSIETAIPTGVFGREATASSVIMSKFAKTAGLGGILGSESTANPDLLLQELLEKQMSATSTKQLSSKTGGGIAVLEDKAAAALLGISGELDKLAETDPKAAAALAGARTLVSTIDETTGQIVYTFDDGIKGMLRTLSENDVNQVLNETATQAMLLDRSSVEAAAEKTKKLLTLQYTGALAGIRVPAGGMPQIGPGTSRELTVEQRVMGSLPDEMQRLSDIAAELAYYQKQYNEELDDSGEEAQESTKQIQVMAQATKELTMALQLEGFDTTVLAHYDSALRKLQMTMEEAAKAAQYAAIEEETRTEFVKHTTGALKGLAVVPQMDFGKSLRELSGQERLQAEMGPGFSTTLARMAGSEQRRDVGVQRITDLRKQKADFDEMVGSLQASKGTLLDEQSKVRAIAMAQGVSEDAIKIGQKVQDTGDKTTMAVQEQTPILDAMLTQMGILAEAAGMTGKAKQEFVQGEIARSKGADVKKLIGATGKTSINDFWSSQLGLRRGEKGFQLEKPAFNVNDEDSPKFTKMMERLRDLKNEASVSASNPGVGRSVPSILKDIAEVEDKIMGLKDPLQAGQKFASMLAQDAKRTEKDRKQQESLAKDAAILADIEKRRAEVLSSLAAAEQSAIADTEKATRELRVRDAFKMAEAVQNFAIGLESIIDEFKKAEMLFYEKKDSDLEGDFARVGQPGFKTTFEQRRAAVEAKTGGPRSLAQMKSDAEELAAIEFDEKEARIKETQNTETNALREQQAQAEKLREILAEQLMSGNLTPEAAGMSKQYLQSLTDQLATSEQASMAGGELSFQGVPALDEARGFLQKIQEEAKAQAAKAEKQFQQEINQPIVDQQKMTNQILTNMHETLKTGQRAAGVGGPGGAVGGAGGAQGYAGMSAGSSGDIMQWMNALGSNPFEMKGNLGGMGYRSNLGTSMGRHGGVDMYQGQADTTGMFVSPQTIRSRTGAGGPMTAIEKMKSLMSIESQSPATMGFSPTGMFKNTSAFTNRSDEAFGSPAARQVGLSNYNQVMESQNALKFGNRNLTSGSVLTDSETGKTPGAQNAKDLGTGKESPAATDQAEALASLSEQFSVLIEAVNNLATTPDQGSTEIVSAIEASGSTLADLLTGTLNVNVENSGLSVVVDGLDTALTGAFGSSGLGSVGSAVADVALRLQIVETFFDPDGPPLGDRIQSAIAPLQTSLETALQDAEDELQEALSALGTTIDTNKRLAEEGIRDVVSTAASLATDLAQQAVSLLSGKGKIETALSQAQQALNLAGRAR